ncbi:hypothetical protein Mapa_006666 [Marchantia paleacea]|nr:hypothetical protein Mapa_006666 [Marchantia paleacea]
MRRYLGPQTGHTNTSSQTSQHKHRGTKFPGGERGRQYREHRLMRDDKELTAWTLDS